MGRIMTIIITALSLVITSTAYALPNPPLQLTGMYDFANGVENLFFTDRYGQIYDAYHDTSGWHIITGASQNCPGWGTTSPTNCFQQAPGTQIVALQDGAFTHVFYLGTYNGSNALLVNELYFYGPPTNGGSWNWNSPSNTVAQFTSTVSYNPPPGFYNWSGPVATSLATVVDNFEDFRVYFTANSDGSLHELYHSASSNWSETAFHAANGFTTPGVPTMPPGRNLTSAWDPDSKIVHLYFYGSDGNLREQYLSSGTWYINNLTAAASGSQVPYGYMSSFIQPNNGDTQFVLGVPAGQVASRTGNVSSFFLWNSSNGWTYTTASSPWRDALSPSVAYSANLSNYAFYVGEDQNVYPVGGNAWTGGAIARAAKGDGGQQLSPITGFFDGTYDHVFYIGTDANIWEFYWTEPSGTIYYNSINTNGLITL